MRESFAVKRLFGAIYVATLSSCSALIDVGGQQCNQDAECVSKELGNKCDLEAHVCITAGNACAEDAECGGVTPRCMQGACVSTELADRWICPDDTQPNQELMIHYRFQVLEFVGQKESVGAMAAACRTSDAGCTDPIASATSDDQGWVEFDLPYGFSGYFDVRANGALPALSYLTRPLKKDTVDRPLQVPSPEAVAFLAATEAVDFDKTKGVALVEAFDCSGRPAGGVQFTESRGGSTAFYIVDHLPNKEATVSVYDSVNDVADGGFVNVQTGFVTFTARWGVDGPLLRSFNAQVRANTVTFVDMFL